MLSIRVVLRVIFAILAWWLTWPLLWFGFLIGVFVALVMYPIVPPVAEALIWVFGFPLPLLQFESVNAISLAGPIALLILHLRWAVVVYWVMLACWRGLRLRAKALKKFAAAWNWKETQDAFTKTHRGDADGELPGSNGDWGYALLRADGCADREYESEAHGFLDGRKILVRCLVAEEALRQAGGRRAYSGKFEWVLGEGTELPVDSEARKTGQEAIWHWRDRTRYDVTVMVYNDKVLLEVANVPLKKMLQERQAQKESGTFTMIRPPALASTPETPG